MAKTMLVIARHGNTFGPGDVVTRVGGRTDLLLVESGFEQGRKLGRALKERGLVPVQMFTSAMQRTIGTAEKAMETIGHTIPSEIVHGFNEIDYGPDENRPEDEVRARVGEDAIKLWDEKAIAPADWIVDVPGLKQAWRDFGERLLREFSGKTVLLVTHNGIARFAEALTKDGQSAYGDKGLKLSTGAFGVFEHDGTTWVCKDWNVKPQ